MYTRTDPAEVAAASAAVSSTNIWSLDDDTEKNPEPGGFSLRMVSSISQAGSVDYAYVVY